MAGNEGASLRRRAALECPALRAWQNVAQGKRRGGPAELAGAPRRCEISAGTPRIPSYEAATASRKRKKEQE